MRIVLLYLIIALIADIIGVSLANQGINNYWVLHIYSPLRVLVLSMFYYVVFKNVKLKKTALACCLAFLIYSITYSVFSQTDYTVYSDHARAISSLLMIILSILWIIELFSKAEIRRIETAPAFYINSAILLYFSVNLFVFIFSEYLLQHQNSNFIYAWSIHSVVYILFNILIFVAYLMQWKTRNSPIS